MNARRAFFLFLILVCLTSVAAPAQAGAPAQSALDAYKFPGETVVLMDKGLKYNGHVYQVHLFTPTPGRSFTIANGLINLQGRLDNREVNGLLITQDGQILLDETVQRKVLELYASVFYLYQANGITPIDDSFSDEMRTVSAGFFYKGVFKTREETILEALRMILSSRSETSGDAKTLADGVRAGIAQKQQIDAAFEAALRVNKFSNNKTVREKAKQILAKFSTWQDQSNLGTIRLSGRDMDLSNGLDLISLGINLVWMADLKKDRAEWLTSYLYLPTGFNSLEVEQSKASLLAIGEARNDWLQRYDLIDKFIRDTAIDYSIKGIVYKAIPKLVWSWKGTRSVGHMVNGTVAKAFGVLSIADLLGDVTLGIQGIYDNFSMGVEADNLRLKFKATRALLEKQARQAPVEFYDGGLAELYRPVYMLESLSAGRVYDLYADGVTSTVGNGGLDSWYKLINYFKGKEWREAVTSIRQMGLKVEEDAEAAVGHPAFVETAIKTAALRLAQWRLTVDDGGAGFVRQGSASFWNSMTGGMGGKALWTYNEANKGATVGSWTVPALTGGAYRVEAYIPPVEPKLPKPLTDAARYTIGHANMSTEVIRNQAASAGKWLDLGLYYFSGADKEYIRLEDRTGKTAGSELVAFDAIRLTLVENPPKAYDASSRGAIATGLAGETVSLVFEIQNSGLMPWDPAACLIIPDFANPTAAMSSIQLTKKVMPGESYSWTVFIPIVGDAGVRTLKYQLTQMGAPVGPTITGYVLVLPEPLKNLKEGLQKQIKEWQEKGTQAVGDFVNSLWQSIQKELEKQAQQWLSKILNDLTRGCQVPGSLLVVAVLWFRMRARHS